MRSAYSWLKCALLIFRYDAGQLILKKGVIGGMIKHTAKSVTAPLPSEVTLYSGKTHNCTCNINSTVLYQNDPIWLKTAFWLIFFNLTLFQMDG